MRGWVGWMMSAAVLAAAVPSTTAARQRVQALARQAQVAYPLQHPELRVFKGIRRLELWAGGKRLKVYPVGLGAAPELDKEREGDHRTPEGRLYICTRNEVSKYHLFLGLSYPDGPAAERGLRDKLITRAQYAAIQSAMKRGTRPPWDTPLGGTVGIHGHGAGSDWTWGCVALENGDIEELWEACPLGTPVVIQK